MDEIKQALYSGPDTMYPAVLILQELGIVGDLDKLGVLREALSTARYAGMLYAYDTLHKGVNFAIEDRAAVNKAAGEPAKDGE